MSPHAITAITGTAAQLAETLRSGDPVFRRASLRRLVRRIELHPNALRFALYRSLLVHEREYGMGALRAPDHGTIVLEEPIALRRRGVEAKLVLRSTPESATTPDPNLIVLLARAHRWFGLLTRGTAQSIREIAELEGANEGDVSLILPLALLAPDITKAILDGRQPPELTARTLKRLRPLPFAWDAQCRLLGFGVSHGLAHLQSHMPRWFCRRKAARETGADNGPL